MYVAISKNGNEREQRKKKENIQKGDLKVFAAQNVDKHSNIEKMCGIDI